ncbi:MAG: sialidase family protein [Opitutaceae bacterium]|nr:sialidase family protein [Opitutaceae bacterium]
MHALARFLLPLVALLGSARAFSAEFSHAAQPQLAATADGRVWLAFGRGQEIYVARSDDQGATFAAPVRVAALPSLMLGKRRGPRLVAHGDRVTVTVMAGELLAFRSQDGGTKWAGPAVVNDVPRSAREGLHGFTVAPDGRLFATWLDLRDSASARMQLFSSESTDGGATWSANRLVYRAPPGQTVCECCHPSAQFDARGHLTVMWRNGVDGARDMWSAVRPVGAAEFGPAAKLGTGTWLLKACPMDGGQIVAEDGGFSTIWQRSGDVFFARPGQPEQKLAPGTQPVAVATAKGSLAVWQQGADLWSASLGTASAPTLRVSNGRFPTLLALPGSDRVLLAYERGPTTVVERL